MRIVGVPERHDLGQGTVGQWRIFGFDQGGVGAAGATHGLRCVVDENVERTLSRDRIGERDHLGRVTQIDTDDAQAVQPILGVVHCREAANGIARKPGGDGGMGAVAQQPQGDIHADFGTAAGEQCALAGEVGASVTLGVTGEGAARAELVVERVDHGVLLLADIAGARNEQLTGGRRAGTQGKLGTPGLVVDAGGRAGGGGSDDAAIGVGDDRAFLDATHHLDRLEHLCGGLAHRDEVGAIRVDVGQRS